MASNYYLLAEKNGKQEVFSEPMRDILEFKGYIIIKRLKSPTIATMQKWLDNGVAKAIDGCEVGPDGTCEHDSPSWLIVLGLI